MQGISSSRDLILPSTFDKFRFQSAEATIAAERYLLLNTLDKQERSCGS